MNREKSYQLGILSCRTCDCREPEPVDNQEERGSKNGRRCLQSRGRFLRERGGRDTITAAVPTRVGIITSRGVEPRLKPDDECDSGL